MDNIFIIAAVVVYACDCDDKEEALGDYDYDENDIGWNYYDYEPEEQDKNPRERREEQEEPVEEGFWPHPMEWCILAAIGMIVLFGFLSNLNLAPIIIIH